MLQFFFKGPLTTANYDSLVSMAATEITNQLETSVMKASFNRVCSALIDLSKFTSWWRRLTKPKFGLVTGELEFRQHFSVKPGFQL